MIINNIKIQSDGYVYCKSGFYSALDIISRHYTYSFNNGINELRGEIDSQIWSVSYLLSMYKYRPKDFILFDTPRVAVNDEPMSLEQLSEYTCYVEDGIYPLFSTKDSVRKLVAKGLKKNKSDYSPDDIRDLFELDSERFERPPKAVGNERIRAMAAIGYCHNKEVFCFPWLSDKRFKNFHNHFPWLLDKLTELKKVAIVPIGYENRSIVEDFMYNKFKLED